VIGHRFFPKRKLQLEQFAQSADLTNTGGVSPIRLDWCRRTRSALVWILKLERRLRHLMPTDTYQLPRSDLKDIVESALARSAVLSGRNLRFEVHEDGVVLRGVVRSYYQKQLAQESLRSISGVSRITNELEVVSV
jgi:hypothetical protein